MKRALVLTNHLIEFGGSEVLALHVALALKALGFTVDIYCNCFGDPMRGAVPGDVFCSDSSDLPNVFTYDVVWSQHSLLALAISQHAIPHSWTTLIFSVHLSPFEPMELGSLALCPSFVDLYLANSPETASALTNSFGISADDIYVFYNACPRAFQRPYRPTTTLERLLIVSNHAPVEVLDAADILRTRSIAVTHAGLPFSQRLVTPDLLDGVDAVITIGRTVQYCVLSLLPVYVYDHFGGPGWLTMNNIDQAEWFNYSGRCTKERKAGHTIADEIVRGYHDAVKFVAAARVHRADLYTLESVLPAMLARATSALRYTKPHSRDETVRIAAANASIIRREYRGRAELLIARNSLVRERDVLVDERTTLLRERDGLLAKRSN